jgi:hypothetical protein
MAEGAEDAGLGPAMLPSLAIDSPALPPAIPPAMLKPESDDQVGLLPTLAELSGGQSKNDFAPIPELAEWGAQALAALGDQAGVEIPPLSTVPEVASTGAASQEAAPLPVNDPTIEEAFAFMPPPPAKIEPARTRSTASVGEIIRTKSTLVWPAAHQSLEADLVDDPQEPGVIMASAFEAPVADLEAPFHPLEVESGGAYTEGEADARPVLDAMAFVEEEEASQAEEWSPPRLAHAMLAPEADDIRQPAARAAQRSEVDLEASADDDENWEVGPSRARRVAVALITIAGVCGIIVGAVVTMRAYGKKPATEKLSAKSLPAASASKQPGKPVGVKDTSRPAVAHSYDKSTVPMASATEASAHAKPAVAAMAAAPAVAAGALASASSTIRLPIATEPGGAMVWIDGEERGNTPCVVKLRPGNARLTLVHAGYLTSQSSIDVREGTKVDVTLTPVVPPREGDARFRAECKTQGKLPVVVDGKETGILCPYSKMRVEPGSHTIGVLVPSTGKVHEKEITLTAGVRSISFGD